MNDKNRIRLIASCLMLVALGVIVTVMCLSVVWLGDDTYFAFNLSEGDWFTLLKSPGDIISSQAIYYMTRNGRFVTHCIVQYFCSFGGKTLFAVCTGLVWIALALVMTRAARFSWRNNPRALCAMAMLAFVCLRTQFSPPCQVNYIWAITAALFVADCFLRGNTGQHWWTTVLLVVFSFLAGWGQESFSSGIAAAMWIYALLSFRRMKWQQWVILVTFTAGMLCLCLAPGNFAKLGSYSSLRVTPVATAYYLHAFYILLAIVLYLTMIKKVSLKQIYKENAFWFNAMFFMGVFNLIVKVYCNRQLFGIEVMSIIIAMRLVSSHMAMPTMFKRLGLGALALMFLLVVIDDAVTISRRVAVVDRIERLYQDSPNGIVYCDIDDEDFLYHDTDAMYSVNNWSLIQLSHLWQTKNRTKPLFWRPTAVKQYVGKDLPSQVIQLDITQQIFMLVHARSQDSCQYQLDIDWHYGPIHVFRGNKTMSSNQLVQEYNPCVITDSCFDALIWRQDDHFIQYTGAQLAQ